MNHILGDIADEFGTPCYVYDVNSLGDRAARTRGAFDEHFKISYAVKANPNRAILERMKRLVELLDISSGGELGKALQAGWDPAAISFTGPAKTDAELKAAVRHRVGYVIVESVGEGKRLSGIAGGMNRTQAILVRISPTAMPAGFGVSMSGRPTPFGIDEEDIEPAIDELLRLDNLRLAGFHIYAGTQCLKEDAIARNLENCVRIFDRLCARYELQPEKLVFGSGLGVPYHPGDVSLDILEVARSTNPAVKAFRSGERFGNTDFVLEMGRYLIGEAGYYLTRVVNIKQSRGSSICVCDGGMHQHLAASGHLGSVIPRNYRMFKVDRGDSAGAEQGSYELAGPLCTSIDRFGRQVKLPALKVGDVICIECSGAYGLTSSPVHFISHEPPKEILVETVDGQPRAVDVTEALH